MHEDEGSVLSLPAECPEPLHGASPRCQTTIRSCRAAALAIDSDRVPPCVAGGDAQHGAASRIRRPDSGSSGGPSSARRSWSASATWTPATGAPTCRAARSSSTACSGWSALASLMAIFMQVIAARLGVVTGKDLAQCCRDWYPRWTRWPNWLLSEVAIGACDLAEVLGSAVAINLLFHIPLLWAVIITGLDVLLLLALQRFGMRMIEAVVRGAGRHHRRLLLHRDFRAAADAAQFSGDGRGRCSRRACARRECCTSPSASSAPRSCRTTSICTRPWCRAASCRRTSARSAGPIRFNTIDSTVALTIAFFVNAAILVLAAMVFFGKESVTVPAGRSSTSTPTATGFASPI